MKLPSGELHPVKIKLLMLCGLCMFFALTSHAQKSNIKFKHLTINDGLSLSSVYCIFEDRKGFIWFGTEDGLNKYDGNKFSIYRSQASNENSLSYKWVEIIFEDAQGKLWFGSKGGLTVFDPVFETFRKYRRQEGNLTGLSNDTITAIKQSRDGSLWIGTKQGLNRINIQTGKSEQISFIGKNITYSSSRIFEIVCEENGDVWVACANGLFFATEKNPVFRLVNPSSKNLRGYVYGLISGKDFLWAGTDAGLVRHEINSGLEKVFNIGLCTENDDIDQKVEKLILDHQGKLWAGTPGGLFLFDHQKGKFTCLAKALDANQSLSVNGAKPICLDSQDNLWYGTFGSGLYRINTSSLEVENYLNNTTDPGSLSQNSLNCIYEDRTGVIWIGTFGAGISVYDRFAHKFKLITHDPQNENSLSSNFIWTVFETAEGSIWAGTNTDGLNRYSPQTGIFTKFMYNPGIPGSLSAASVRKVYQDSKGIIWVGTDGGGLNRFDPESETFSQFVSDPNNPNSLTGNSIRVIYEDRAGNLWIGTRNGLNKMDRNTGTFKRFTNDPANPQSISHNFIYSVIHEDQKGNLWMGTYGGGLIKMDIENEAFSSYIYDPNKPEGISDDVVFSIFEENNGILWIGTNDGLNRFDPEQESFIRFGVEQGLPNEVIYGVLPDGKNNIWLSTNLGISKFNLSNYNVENYDAGDGLQSNEFNGGAFHGGKSGKLYFGGVYGLNIINPTKVLKAQNISTVVLTGIDILGKKVKFGNGPESTQYAKTSPLITEFEEQFFMQTNISYAREIELDYKHRFLGFEFATLNNSPSDKVTYRYKMQNLDEDWNFSGTRNFVNYANMSPGRYVFVVSATNKAGQLTSSPAKLKIIISPPYWKTWWFYTLELMAALFLIAFIYVYLLKIRTNKLLLSQNQQIQETNLRLTESEKKLKELNTTKDKFFSIIAHDLKNPFTSLLSIGELLSKNYDSMDEEDKKTGIDGFYNSSKRIYSLLENLLVWSRSQTGRVKFCPVEFDISELAEECYDLMALSAEKKKLDFHIWANENQRVFADREMIHTVLRNLLHNAIKYSSPGGKISLQLKEIENDLLKIAVIDEGVGISGDRLSKLFCLASKSNSNGTAGEKGTGLGLIVCREFIEKNKSKLLVKSKVGQGSEFSFHLQLKSE